MTGTSSIDISYIFRVRRIGKKSSFDLPDVLDLIHVKGIVSVT